MRLSTILKGLFAIMFAIMVTAVAILYSTDFNAYKGDIRNYVREATGRDLVIEGDFKPSMGLSPSVVVDRVRFSNAAWGTRKEMMRIGQLRAELELLPVFFGEIRIKKIVLSGADIFLESRADGIGNWVLDSETRVKQEEKASGSGGAQTIPTFDRILIENSSVTWRDGKSGVTNVTKIDRLSAQAEELSAPVRIDFSGAYDGHPVRLNGAIGSLSNIVAGSALPLDLMLFAGGAKVTAKGNVERPADGAGVVLRVKVSGDNLSTLSGLTGVQLPAIGPYDLSATVIDQDHRWQFKGLKLAVGGSDLAGNIVVDPVASPVAVDAKLKSTLLRAIDFRDRNASVTDVRSGEGALSSSSNSVAQRVFDDDLLPFEGLRSIDVAISLRAKRIETATAKLRDANADLSLRKGILTIRPAKAVFLGGKFSVGLKISTTGSRPTVDLSFDMAKLDLAEIIKEKGHPGLLTGKVDAKVSLSGTGGSVRSIMAGLNGTVEVAMQSGLIHRKLLDLLGSDALDALAPLLSGEKGIEVKCLVGRYGIRNGMLRSEATVFDTSQLLVVGDGGINLATEEIDFAVNPTARDVGLLALRVGGTLASPSVFPDSGAIARGAVGVATGLVTGSVIGAVIGKIVSGSSGEKDANPCLAALRIKKPEPNQKTNTRAESEGNSSPSKAAGEAIRGVEEGLKAPVEGAGKVIKGVGDGLKDLFGR